MLRTILVVLPLYILHSSRPSNDNRGNLRLLTLSIQWLLYQRIEFLESIIASRLPYLQVNLCSIDSSRPVSCDKYLDIFLDLLPEGIEEESLNSTAHPAVTKHGSTFEVPGSRDISPHLSELPHSGAFPHLYTNKSLPQPPSLPSQATSPFTIFIRQLNYVYNYFFKMPGLIQEPHFEHITIKEIGPTFAAEVEGVDLSQEIPQEVFDEILKAISKVSWLLPSDLQHHSHNCTVWRPRFQGHRSRRYPTR
jgi:hypothetical protein